MPTPRLPPMQVRASPDGAPRSVPRVRVAQGELQNVVVALISRKSISAGRTRLSKENNGDESQEAIREREVLLLCLPFVRRSRVPGKRGRKSQVAQPGWSSS